MALRRQRTSEKVRAGPGLKECEAGFETSNCGELRVRWRWLVGKWGIGHKVAKGDAWDITRPLEEREREERGGWTRIESVKLDTRQTIVESCALDGEGYVSYERGDGRVKDGVANRTWPIQDIERDVESRIKKV